MLQTQIPARSQWHWSHSTVCGRRAIPSRHTSWERHIRTGLAHRLTEKRRQSGFKNQRRPEILAPHTRWANCCRSRSNSHRPFTGLRQAAEQNDPYAQYRLGKLLLTGAEGVPKDIDAAIQLLKGSAAQGNQFAQYTLGKLYLLGQEVQADREAALHYFAQAAAQGNTYAQYFIDHQEDFSSAAAGTAILRMLHQMSRIFRENAAQPAIYAGMQIDKKRRRRLQEKRMAMGHKADDHEDRGLTQQTQ